MSFLKSEPQQFSSKWTKVLKVFHVLSYFFSFFPVRLSSQKCFCLSLTRRALRHGDICTRLAVQFFLRDTNGAANWLPVIARCPQGDSWLYSYSKIYFLSFFFQIISPILIGINPRFTIKNHLSLIKMFAGNSRLISIVPESVSL